MSTPQKTPDITGSSLYDDGSGHDHEYQNQLVDLWLSGEKNEARIILESFKIGLEEGQRRAKQDNAGTEPRRE